MKLICINPQLATVYGLPAQDLDAQEALKLLANLGAGAQTHLDCAISAGAFKPNDPPASPAWATKKSMKEDRDG